MCVVMFQASQQALIFDISVQFVSASSTAGIFCPFMHAENNKILSKKSRSCCSLVFSFFMWDVYIRLDLYNLYI